MVLAVSIVAEMLRVKSRFSHLWKACFDVFVSAHFGAFLRELDVFAMPELA